LEERLARRHRTGLQALLDLEPRRGEFVGVGRREGHRLDPDDQLLAPGA